MHLTATKLNWTIIPTNDQFGSYPISNYSGYRDPSLTGLFYLNQSGLVILNATTSPNDEGPISTSGLYIADCGNIDSRTGSKFLVVRKCLNKVASNTLLFTCSCYYYRYIYIEVLPFYR